MKDFLDAFSHEMKRQIYFFTLCDMKRHWLIEMVKLEVENKMCESWKHDWMDPLRTTSKNGQGTRIGQILFLDFSKNHNYKLLFFHVYLLHAKIYGLKFPLQFLKNENHYRFVFLISRCEDRNKVLKLWKFIIK